jgi:lipoate-protein ligase A
LTSRWRVEHVTGPAAELVGRPDPAASEPVVSLLTVTAPAIVLGSTQPETAVDRARLAAAGLDLAQRRSGGGAVLVRPDALLWADVFVPAGDGLWTDDVGRAFYWLGQAWVSALGGLGITARWHHGTPRETPWSRLVCFAGVGPGEVLVDGRKVVGLAQRRTRAGARFHCAALREWHSAALIDVLAVPEPDRARAAGELASVAAGLDVDLATLEAAFLAQLP